MTLKEIAVDLMDKFYEKGINGYDCRQCALIAVEEILGAIDWHEFEVPNEQIDFWNKIKQELENL